jgi:hypothetical protein
LIEDCNSKQVSITGDIIDLIFGINKFKSFITLDISFATYCSYVAAS